MTKIYGFPSKGKERTRINKKEKKEDITFYEFFSSNIDIIFVHIFWCKDRKNKTNQRKKTKDKSYIDT